MREQRRLLPSMLQPFRRQLLHLSTTPTTTLDIRRASHGPRPTQAKSLSLEEYVFLTGITFMFTLISVVGVHTFSLYYQCQFIPSPPPFLLVCLLNLKKNQKNQLQLVYFLCMLSFSIKRKPKKISRSSFACWEFSRVNSFISFLSLGVDRRRP